MVRLHLMRNTMHLVSARDCLDWRALFHRLHAAELRGALPPRRPRASTGRRCSGTPDSCSTARPRTGRSSASLLSEHWPDPDPLTLAYAATHHLALCQVPPRGVWGGPGGQAAWAPVETWLGAPLRAGPPDDLVLRYLGAFGPATVADLQVWSGLTRLREVVDRLAVRTFRGKDGQTLHDLPDAPRPSADTPAPPRLLPAYDNLLLSHEDRSRVIVDGRRVPLPPGSGATVGTFLVDGWWQGTWQVRDRSLHLEPFTPLRPADADALRLEAERLCAFLDPQGGYEVVGALIRAPRRGRGLTRWWPGRAPPWPVASGRSPARGRPSPRAPLRPRGPRRSPGASRRC